MRWATQEDELEEGDTLKLAVAGALDAGTYTVRFDNGSGSVYAIEVAVSEGATYIFVDTGDLGDEASGNFDIDVVDDSGSSLLDSGAASVNISQRLYLHYGLHSPVVATNSDGETVWRRAYLPFGADFAGSSSHPITIANSSITHGFVGRRSDNDVGLYQLGARWYDPDLGRFVSVDPVSGYLNQYAYANNNPFVYQDGNGRDPFGLAGLMIYAAAGISVGVTDGIVYGLGKVGGIPEKEVEKSRNQLHNEVWDAATLPGDICFALSFTEGVYKIAKNPRGIYNGVKGSWNRLKGLFKGSADDAAGGVDDAVKWVDENAHMSQKAKAYNDSATGARSNVATQKGQAPQITRTLEDGTTKGVRFDGVEGNALIDRKLSVVTTQKAKDQALRQSQALMQNNLTGKWEVPNQAEANRAKKLFEELGIDNILVEVVNGP